MSIAKLVGRIRQDVEDLELPPADQSDDQSFNAAVKDVTQFVRDGKPPAKWTGEHVRVFRLALSRKPARMAQPAERKIPTEVLDDVEAAVLSLA